MNNIPRNAAEFHRFPINPNLLGYVAEGESDSEKGIKDLSNRALVQEIKSRMRIDETFHIWMKRAVKAIDLEKAREK